MLLHLNLDSEDKCWLRNYELAKLGRMREKDVRRALRGLLKKRLILEFCGYPGQRFIVPLTYKWRKPLDPGEPLP